MATHDSGESDSEEYEDDVEEEGPSCPYCEAGPDDVCDHLLLVRDLSYGNCVGGALYKVVVKEFDQLLRVMSSVEDMEALTAKLPRGPLADFLDETIDQWEYLKHVTEECCGWIEELEGPLGAGGPGLESVSEQWFSKEHGPDVAAEVAKWIADDCKFIRDATGPDHSR